MSETRSLISSQHFIINPMKELGFFSTYEGACLGISMSFILSEVIGKSFEYIERFKFLKSTSDIVEKLRNHNAQFTSIKFSGESKTEALIDEERTLVNILALFYVIKSFQEPHLISPFLDGLDLTQSDRLIISKIVGSNELERKKGLASLYCNAVLYEPFEFCNYLEYLRNIIKEENLTDFRLALYIKFPTFTEGGMEISHAIALAYDTLNDSWILFDPNFPAYTKDMIKEESHRFFGEENSKKLLTEAYIKNGNVIKILYEDYFAKSFTASSDELKSHELSIAKPLIIPAYVEIFTVGLHPRLNHLKMKFDKFKITKSKGLPDFSELKSREGLYGYTLAHIAANNGSIDVLTRLKEEKFNFNIRNKKGYTPLHFACVSSAQILDFLIEEKSNLNSVTEKGYTPAMTAVDNGLHFKLEILAKAGADLAQPNLKDKNNAVIHMCACFNNIESMRVLVKPEYKVNLNQTNRGGATAAHSAAVKNHSEIIKILREAGANLEMRTYADNKFAPIHLAAQFDAREVLLELIKGHIDLDVPETKFGDTAVCMAANHNKPEILSILGKAGANFKKANNKRCTPIHYAAYKGHIEAVKILLQYGADPLDKDIDGDSAIFCAVAKNHMKIAILLLLANTSIISRLSKSDEKLIQSNKERLLPELDVICSSESLTSSESISLVRKLLSSVTPIITVSKVKDNQIQLEHVVNYGSFQN